MYVPRDYKRGGNSKSMFELNVDVKVSLHTGALITLTEEQNHRIKNYAIEVILGPAPVAPVVTKRAYNKKKGHNLWSKEDSDKVLAIVNKFYYTKPGSREIAGALKDLSKQLGREKNTSVVSRYYYLRKQRAENETKEAKKWSPVAIRIEE